MAKKPFQQLKQYYSQRGGEGNSPSAAAIGHNASIADIDLSISDQMPQYVLEQYN